MGEASAENVSSLKGRRESKGFSVLETSEFEPVIGCKTPQKDDKKGVEARRLPAKVSTRRTAAVCCQDPHMTEEEDATCWHALRPRHQSVPSLSAEPFRAQASVTAFAAGLKLTAEYGW